MTGGPIGARVQRGGSSTVDTDQLNVVPEDLSRTIGAIGTSAVDELLTRFAHRDEIAAHIADGRDAYRYINSLAVFAKALCLEMLNLLALPQAFNNIRKFFAPVRGINERDGLTDRLARRITKQLFSSWIPINDSVFSIN